MNRRRLAFAGIVAAAAGAAAIVGRSFHGRAYRTAEPDPAPGKSGDFTALPDGALPIDWLPVVDPDLAALGAARGQCRICGSDTLINGDGRCLPCFMDSPA